MQCMRANLLHSHQSWMCRLHDVILVCCCRWAHLSHLNKSARMQHRHHRRLTCIGGAAGCQLNLRYTDTALWKTVCWWSYLFEALICRQVT